jgi:hypothetical protein
MNISPSALLAIVVATAIANILILVMLSLRNKSNRSRRLAAVENILSTSYFEGGAGEPRPGPVPDQDDQGGDAPESGTPTIDDESDGIDRTNRPIYEEAWTTMEREAYDADGSPDTDAADAATGDAGDQPMDSGHPVMTEEPVMTEDPVMANEPDMSETSVPTEAPELTEEPVAMDDTVLEPAAGR